MLKRLASSILLASVGIHSLHAGGDPGLMFKSGFEFIESCIEFDGLGDSIIIPVITVSGDFLHNGGDFPVSEFDDANISFRNRLTGGTFEIGNTHDQDYSVNIIPGNYDVLYSVETPGAEVPRNVGAVVMSGVGLYASQTLDIDVTSYLLGGQFLLNGVQFPQLEYDDGVIFLESEVGGTLELGNTHAVFSNVPVIPGDYTVRYQLETPGEDVPRNTWGLVGPVTVSGNDPSMDINVTSVAISGTFEHNSVAMSSGDDGNGNFYLETAAGDSALLGNSHDETFQINVIPGTYDLYWEKDVPGNDIPFNPRARVAAGVAVAGGVVPVDMNSHLMSGNLTLNSFAFPVSDQESGRILARDAATGDGTVLRQTHFGSYNRRMAEATYDLYYQHDIGSLVPQNQLAFLGTTMVQKDVAMDINVQAGTFVAFANHNGVPFPADMFESGFILVRDRDSADWANVGRTSTQPIQSLLVADSYDVYYSHSLGDTVPRNGLALIYENVEIEPPPPVEPEGGGGLTLEVDSVLINGQIFRNDVSPPADEFDDGVLTMYHGFDALELANTHDQSYETRIIDRPEPTLYFVNYSVETPGPIMPWNVNAYVMCLVLDPVPF